MNRESVVSYMRTLFGCEGERLWRKYPDYLVFRNRRNKKWFAVVMDVEKNKLGLSGTGKVDVINLKADPFLIGDLLTLDGYFPAYHMNKVHWITVLLDRTGKDDELKALIRESYGAVDAGRRR